MSDRFVMSVNGTEVTLEHVEPRTRLADLLRERFGLTSVHLGCEQGICGCCTVLVDGWPVKSCIVLAFQARDTDVQTLEGLADGDDLHPMQQAFIDNYALQCGFCTPGMILSACALLERDPSPSEGEIREAISGNLCRCTGYEPIVNAIQRVAAAKTLGDHL
jgi:aerobic carbon-monoxide dehydrogenase small subunit